VDVGGYRFGIRADTCTLLAFGHGFGDQSGERLYAAGSSEWIIILPVDALSVFTVTLRTGFSVNRGSLVFGSPAFGEREHERGGKARPQQPEEAALKRGAGVGRVVVQSA
jgi:hypothetical protein